MNNPRNYPKWIPVRIIEKISYVVYLERLMSRYIWKPPGFLSDNQYLELRDVLLRDFGYRETGVSTTER